MRSSKRSRKPSKRPATASGSDRQSAALMATIVTMHVVGDQAPAGGPARREAIDRAFGWFRLVERICTRFDPRSELMQLTARHGTAVPVSELLFQAIQFALAVAHDSGGAFDPTVGGRLEAAGFNREYSRGGIVDTPIPAGAPVSHADVELDPAARTVRLARPLILDLGAVAKGLAIDLAARELQPFGNFAIDAGGDLYLSGCNPAGEPWTVGIRHPRRDRGMLRTIRVSDCAVCTSGDYERRDRTGGGHHIVDPRSGISPPAVASATVIAPSAMLADALATAAFVLGPDAGLAMCARHGVEGLIVTTDLQACATAAFDTDYPDASQGASGAEIHDAPLFPHA
jgi:thiamine biosynthesis lipoprotein